MVVLFEVKVRKQPFHPEIDNFFHLNFSIWKKKALWCSRHITEKLIWRL